MLAFLDHARLTPVTSLGAVGLRGWPQLTYCAALFENQSARAYGVCPLEAVAGQKRDQQRHAACGQAPPTLRRHLLEWFRGGSHGAAVSGIRPPEAKVSNALHYFAVEGHPRRDAILDGLPHPSGADTKRTARFLGAKTELSRTPSNSPSPK